MENNVSEIKRNTKRNGKELNLEYPIQFQDREVKKVFVRRMKGKDMRLLPASGPETKVAIEEMFPICCALMDEPEEFLDEMDSVDVESLMEIVSEFMEGKGKGKKK